MQGRVLIIAGSDPSGGAGIQADIKTVTALGGYAAAAITALTVQNTLGVTRVEPCDPSLVRDQMRAVLDDIGADAIKIGLLPNASVVKVVAAELKNCAAPIVLDPVLVATSGDALAEGSVGAALREELFPLAHVVTPNTDEALALGGVKVSAEADLAKAARALLALGAKAVLVKGGHLDGANATNTLVTEDGETRYSRARIKTKHTHGTGCTLASAIATGLAQGQSLSLAISRATSYVHAAILTAPGYGGGAGPLNHAVFDYVVRPDENWKE